MGEEKKATVAAVGSAGSITAVATSGTVAGLGAVPVLLLGLRRLEA